MPNNTLNDIVDIILMLGKYCYNYQEAIELYYFPDRQYPNDRTLHDLCWVNDSSVQKRHINILERASFCTISYSNY